MEALAVLLCLLALALGAAAGFVFGRRTAPTSGAADAERLALTDARQDAAMARAEASRAREDAAMSKAEIAQHLAEKSDLRAAASEAQRMVAEARSETAHAAARVAAATAQRDAAIQRSAEQATDRESLLAEFKVLSAESLDRQSRQADAVADQRLKATEQLVGPLSDGLRQMQEKLQLVETERARMAAELGEQVTTLRRSGEAIRRETLSLSNALRTPQVRGSWGESSLKRIVEISGLTERCDFDAQRTYVSDDGTFRPDLRVNLPAGKVIFVDSKVPLAAVLDAYQTEDPTEQKRHLRTFAAHVRTHVDQLADKNYWQLDAGSPEFVVLYLPSDEFYRLALEQAPDLHEYATRKHIVLASPGLLIPQLQIVANGWRQVAVTETAAQVSRLGRELYERLATLGSHFDKLGRSLSASVGNYNKTVAAMESRVMVSARRFRDFGISPDELDELATVSETTRQMAVAEMLDYEDSRARESEALSQAESDRLVDRVQDLRRREA